MAVKDDISLIQGKTFTDLLRWETTPIVRVAIKGVTTPNGDPRIETLTAHGLVDGWRCAVTGVRGMTELNAADPNKIKDAEYYQATDSGATFVELNEVNASEFKVVPGESLLVRCKTAGPARRCMRHR